MDIDQLLMMEPESQCQALKDLKQNGRLLPFLKQLKQKSLDSGHSDLQQQKKIIQLIQQCLLPLNLPEQAMALWALSVAQAFSGQLEQSLQTEKEVMHLYQQLNDQESWGLILTNHLLSLDSNTQFNEADTLAQTWETTLCQHDNPAILARFYWYWAFIKLHKRALK